MVDTTNEIGREQVEPFMRRIESYYRDMESEKGAYMNTCRGYRNNIKDVIKEAADYGIPREAMQRAIKTLKLQRQLNANRRELESDLMAAHDQIVTAVEGLEDLPLGIAAVERETRERATRRPTRRANPIDQLAAVN
jgi:uncharacterized protein (UPF0335 family)